MDEQFGAQRLHEFAVAFLRADTYLNVSDYSSNYLNNHSIICPGTDLISEPSGCLIAH